MQTFLIWWAVLLALGAMAVPYVFVVFRHLPDRGIGFAKVFGLLSVSYVVWLSGNLRAIPNGRGAVVLALFFFALGGFLIFTRNRTQLAGFLKEQSRTIAVYEVVFALAFAGWAAVRAFNPNIEGTEKPMDLAMLNAALRAESFPPLDPWLSGHTIQYYYFGYLNMSVLAQLTGTPPAVGFNLCLAFLFAAAATGMWSLVTNLVSAHLRVEAVGRSIPGDYFINGGQASTPLVVSSSSLRLSESNDLSNHERERFAPANNETAAIPGSALFYGGVGAFLLMGMGNLVGVLELARAHGGGSPVFWNWVAVKDVSGAYQSASWYPDQGWWWWHATRVIDTVQAGQSLDYTITEFPFFSFLLGDLHPHVMSLPFVMLALGFTANVFWGPAPSFWLWLNNLRGMLLPGALILGSLGFINGWDLGPFMLLFLGTGALRILLGWTKATRETWLDFFLWAALVSLAAFLLYAPFYASTGFGVLGALTTAPQDAAVKGFPVAWWNGPGTRPLHFLLIWLPFMTLSDAYLIALVRARMPERSPILLGVVVGAVGAWLLIELGMLILPERIVEAHPFILLLQRTWLLGPLAVALLVLKSFVPSWDQEVNERSRDAALVFALALLIGGLALLTLSESFRIKDVFGNRMNTVFKLYYQTWLFLSCLGGFAVYYVNQRLWRGKVMTSKGLLIWNGTVALIIGAGSVYSMAALLSKTDAFNGPANLDGLAYVEAMAPGELEALQWLRDQPRDPQAVVLEATGLQYTRYGRVSSATGMPTVLGWAGHEVQWRGSDALFRGRTEDIARMYSEPDKTQVLPLLQKYNVRYVYIGALERTDFPAASLAGFEQVMDTAFRNQGATIFRVRDAAGAG